MTKYSCYFLLLMLPKICLANCELTHFRWLCEIPIKARADYQTPSVIDCGGTKVFVTRNEYEEIMRYQRVGMNMTLKVNGEYVKSPCIPVAFHVQEL